MRRAALFLILWVWWLGLFLLGRGRDINEAARIAWRRNECEN